VWTVVVLNFSFEYFLDSSPLSTITVLLATVYVEVEGLCTLVLFNPVCKYLAELTPLPNDAESPFALGVEMPYTSFRY